MNLLKRLLREKKRPALYYDQTQHVGPVKTPFPLIECSGTDAQAVIAKEANNREHTPIILGSLRSLEMLNDLPSKRSVAEVLSAANKFDFDSWFAEAKREQPPREDIAITPRHEPLDAIQIAAQNPLTQKPANTVYIGLIPTSDPTEVPAHFDAGGWNEFPVSEVHVALMRRWRDRYGARLIGHQFDTLVFHVQRPPTTAEDALKLAEEHYAYCPDRVDQGSDSLDALACWLLKNPSWYFWWD
ncbi:DUF4253 domain-containing protein [Marivivens aquimaris]|uniref:DUF4253 domain-containing protein n=1 Tax=Marivivens aquimaris TaxID=2774876 RepID=UPI0018816B17|nr:DUF4253 domain-containing protein [Marivivens aquimaris]